MKYELLTRQLNNPSVCLSYQEGIPFQSFGSGDQMIQFVGANGYTPLAYTPLWSFFEKDFQIQSMLLRPLWRDSRFVSIEDWRPFVDDFCQYTSSCKKGSVIGMGHSIGATIVLMSAILHPERFKKIVLIDPALFSTTLYRAYRFMKFLRLHRRFHPFILPTLQRQKQFSSKEAVFERYRQKSIFKYFSTESLEAYIDGSFVQTNQNEWELVYSRKWESHIYEIGMSLDPFIYQHLSSLKIPVCLIRGKYSDICTNAVVDKFNKSCADFTDIVFDESSHLVPLELPEQVYNSVISFAQRG